MADDHVTEPVLKKTPLHALHRALGAKLVPFAGYDMPVQYPMGVLKEHVQVRQKAGLFDVSHMGQCFLNTLEAEVGTAIAHDRIAAALETLVPGEIAKLKPGRTRYTVLLNEHGGIMDDLMVTRPPMEAARGRLFLVVNAAVKDQDFAVFREKLVGRAELQLLEGFGLLALQGPKAAEILAAHAPEVATMPFMSARPIRLDGRDVFCSRCGYTGEDGFEISTRPDDAEAVARLLLDHDDVEPIGLGARDSLRLEAGLCLYGHDMDTETNPVEANLTFAIGKRRREEGGFAGCETILAQMKNGADRLRVGLRPEGRAPVREGAEIQDTDGQPIGKVTSGGFAPTLGGPIAMGYVPRAFGDVGQDVHLILRGKPVLAQVVDMPFVTQNYYRG